MLLTQSPTAYFLALSFLGSKDYSWDEIPPSQTLQWYPCLKRFHCAKLDVPLDYQNPGLGRAAVPLLKHSAQARSSDGPYQGMILVNPGGPGSSGVEEVRYQGAEVAALVGSNWDIVGFDPRGIYRSEPLLDCSVNFTRSQDAQLVFNQGVPRLLDDYYEEYIDYAKRLGKHCQHVGGGDTDAGPHMSTAVTARDMASIVDAFAATRDGERAAKESHLLNYYGISYGTFLGQTYASMFPEKVGNMVIDGVVNPKTYLEGSGAGFINHLDGIIGSYFIYCYEAGVHKCPFSARGSSARDLYERFNRSFSQLDPHEAQAKGWKNATDIQTSLRLLKLAMFNAAYFPMTTFANFSSPLISLESSVMAQNLKPFISDISLSLGDSLYTLLGNGQWIAGILCSDQENKHQGKTLDDMRSLIEELERQSIIGETWIRAALLCVGWTIESTDVFTGPFGGDTATPMLFVANTYDSVTPIEDARRYAPKFKDAQVLTIDAIGHTSLAALNVCAMAKMRAYFQNSSLPNEHSHCSLEKGPFGVQLEGTLTANLRKEGLSDLRL